MMCQVPSCLGHSRPCSGGCLAAGCACAGAARLAPLRLVQGLRRPVLRHHLLQPSVLLPCPGGQAGRLRWGCRAHLAAFTCSCLKPGSRLPATMRPLHCRPEPQEESIEYVAATIQRLLREDAEAGAAEGSTEAAENQQQDQQQQQGQAQQGQQQEQQQQAQQGQGQQQRRFRRIYCIAT